MIPVCFGHPKTLLSNNSDHSQPQSLITCIYQIQLCNMPTYLTLSWSRTPASHSLTVHVGDSSVTVPIRPQSFPFLSTRMGSKSICLTHNHHCHRLKLHCDFSLAEFPHNSAEPDSYFYIAISCNSKVDFFLGDLQEEFTRRYGMVGTLSEPTLLSRREHLFGRRSYVSWVKFLGSKHEFGIECKGGVLKVKIDGKTCVVVKRLKWKFRGNARLYIDGIEVEFFWDVFHWVSDNTNNNDNNMDNDLNAGEKMSKGGGGHGVFIFQVGDGGIWPEMVGPEKKLMRKSSSLTVGPTKTPSRSISPSVSSSSVLQWAEESSECGRSSSSSVTSKSCGSNNGGLSLLFYAWRKI